MCLFCSSCRILLSIFKTLQACVELLCVENCTTAVTLVQNIECPKQIFTSNKNLFLSFFKKKPPLFLQIFTYKGPIWNLQKYNWSGSSGCTTQNLSNWTLRPTRSPVVLYSRLFGRSRVGSSGSVVRSSWTTDKTALGNEEHLRHIPVALYFNKEMIPTRSVLWPENSNNMCLCCAGRKAWVENRSCCI